MPTSRTTFATSLVGFVLLGTYLGCVAVPTQPPPPTLPIKHSSVRDQLVFYSDFPLTKNDRLLDELTAQRGVLSETLALPTTDEPIHVFLFRSPDSFERFIRRRHPDFPVRRAFFVQTDAQLAIYAHWGQRVAEDLRHEVAHGYLHAALRDIPLWLDEGLAEYFEVPLGDRGLHLPHLAELTSQISENDWTPDLQRLEAIASVAEMTQLDYAEAWAWIYFLLETEPDRRTELQEHLALMRDDGPCPPLSLALRQRHVDPNRTLRDFIVSKAESLP